MKTTFLTLLLSFCLLSCDKFSGEIPPNCPLYVDAVKEPWYYNAPYSCPFDPTKKIRMKGRTTLGYYNSYRYSYDQVAKTALFTVGIYGVSCNGIIKEQFSFWARMNEFELNKDNVADLNIPYIQQFRIKSEDENSDFTNYKVQQKATNTFTVHKFNPETQFIEASLNLTLENEGNPQDIIKLEASHFQMGFCNKYPVD